MSILINGMEMPTRGHTTIRIYADGTVEHEHTERKLGTAIPVTDHGRLVDGDKIVEGCKDKEGRYISQFAAAIGETVEAAPTIIPADKEGEV